ncbi:MAG TPA: endonuclease/exonuclease/phosphatase family protein [Bacteroidales bacterium]|nr:endonuclease/exonuclease/phosphatase family protein [Bacteroidales bacterium]
MIRFKCSILLTLAISLAACGTHNGGVEKNVTENIENTSRHDPGEFNILFYNTENLYDTRDDPAIEDGEFTPEAKIPWTPERFELKLERIADVFCSVVSPAMPDIIGLAEVENKGVLDALCKTKGVNTTAYGIVHFDSRDERGIDVALLYNKNTFIVTESKPLAVKTTRRVDHTRDILYVKGKTTGGQVIHFFVNHWPSRREGKLESEPGRLKAASILRQKVDEIFRDDANAGIIIMGDFNDEPNDVSLSRTLNALPPAMPFTKSALYNLLYSELEKGQGTTYFKDWDLFDQFIVSGNLLTGENGLHCNPGSASIFKPLRLIHRDRKGTTRPNRTMGEKYYGGYSDHLPVLLELRKQ